MARLRFLTHFIVCHVLLCCLNAIQFNFSNTYGNYMVLQHGNGNEQIGAHAQINGISPYPSDKVTVKLSTFDDQNTILQTKTVDVINNTWQVLLDPVNASLTEYYIAAYSAVNKSDTISLSHILFGDVYLCSGQSNMQFTVDQANNVSQSLEEANHYPNIRLFTALDETANSEQTQLIGIEEPWSIASNTTVGGGDWTFFSAVCWFYGKDLYDKLKYPIGLIASSWGGTPIRPWMSSDAIAKCPNETIYDDTLSLNGLYGPSSDSVLWNSMIYPFLTMTIKGVIWYQGEQDTANEKYSESYSCAFKAMISDWRLKWNEYTNNQTSILFPFGFVQLSTWGSNSTCTQNWTQCIGVAQVRYAQTANYGYVPNKDLPNVYMAIATDLGMPGNIHTKYKQQISKRLSNAALNMIYNNKDIYWLGPYAHNVTCLVDTNSKKSTVIVNFANVNSDGLLLKNPTGFEYYNTTLKQWIYINQNILNVTNNGIGIQFVLNATDINRVRYDWYQAPCLPTEGIYNCAVYDKKELLPAALFILPVTCS